MVNLDIPLRVIMVCSCLPLQGIITIMECGGLPLQGIMVYGGLPWLWEAAGHAVAATGYDAASSEILQTVAFVAIGNVITTVIGLPWAAYFTFKVEQKHGFNKQVRYVLLCEIRGSAAAAL